MIHSKTWVIFASSLIILLFLSGCRPDEASWLDPLPIPTQNEHTSADEVVRIYFTAPANDDYRGGPDQYLAEAIDQGKNSIEGALYDLNLWSIRNALIRAHQRGVIIRLVVESDSLDRVEIQELIAAGIPVVEDQSESLMHNKFLVIDGGEVWTGSMNLTVNGAYRHLNNLIRIRSTRLAENFQQEFEEMYEEGYFGEISLNNTPHPRISLDGIGIETYFSPDDSPAYRIIDLILKAEESIDFMYYSFTSDGIADAILFQATQGIEVRGVFDSYQDQAGIGGEFQRLSQAGLNVLLDAHPEKMHHKVLIIDRQIVITGSYNLTKSAETKNDENLLVIHDPDIAGVYLGEFEWIYEDANYAR